MKKGMLSSWATEITCTYTNYVTYTFISRATPCNNTVHVL